MIQESDKGNGPTTIMRHASAVTPCFCDVSGNAVGRFHATQGRSNEGRGPCENIGC